MVQQGQIDHLLKETGQIEPPASLVQQAFLQDYEVAYRDSMESPEAFWEGVASELEWTRRWDSVFQWDYPTFRWFLGAKCNITQNALDRHLTNGNRNKAAFIWLGEDGTERVFTYGRLAQLVNRFANGLRSLGVGKGDRVIIYMPLTPEGAIAMLACARIGAVHSVVYAGFSSGSLRDRITRRPGQGGHHRRRGLPPRQRGRPAGHHRAGRRRLGHGREGNRLAAQGSHRP